MIAFSPDLLSAEDAFRPDRMRRKNANLAKCRSSIKRQHGLAYPASFAVRPPESDIP